MPVTKICEVCASSFTVPPVRANTAKACSHECAVKVRAKSKECKVDASCKECGSHFQVPQSHLNRRVYCSLGCREKSAETVSRKADRVGDKNPMWAGGVVKQSDGYLYEKSAGHPFASNGYVLQHRLVVERHLRFQHPDHPFLIEVDGQKYIKRELDVHHINKDKSDNDPSNLAACTSLAHSMFHRGMQPQQSDYWLAAPI